MKLNEEILRIKKIINIITESEEEIIMDLFPNTMETSIDYNSDVEKLQKFLVSKGYNLSGVKKNRNPINGKYNRITKKAHQAFLDNVSPSEFDKEMLDDYKKKEKEGRIDMSSDKRVQFLRQKNIIIGDSQTPYVDMNTDKASRISNTAGPQSLWKGGETVDWLIKSLEKFVKAPNVENVIIVIGTNGMYGKLFNDDIPKLFKLLKVKFPNANFFAVQGSWGWGGLAKVKEENVRKYYKKFEQEGATIIEPPIGNVEPHGNRPVYELIGAKIDSLLE